MAESKKPGTDEKYCSDCGSVIKKNAEICPECGVRQTTAGGHSSDTQTRKLQKIAEKDKTTAAILGVLISPAGYYYVGSTKWTLINIVTFNYMILGIIIVPLHAMKIIDDAREELDETGAQYNAPD